MGGVRTSPDKWLGSRNPHLKPTWMGLAKLDAASAEPTSAQIKGDGKPDEAFLACGEGAQPLNVLFRRHGSSVFPLEHR